MNQDPNNPFNWRLRGGSIFSKDPAFTPRKDGKTDSQRATDVVERKRTEGSDPGLMYGIGELTSEKEERMLAYRQFGAFSRATPSNKKPNKHQS